MNIDNITHVNSIIINRKIVYLFNPFEIFPKHNGYGFVSESFALN